MRHRRQQQGDEQDAHRQVQEEGVVPAYILRQPSTDKRAEHRPKNGGDAEQRVADRLLRAGEEPGGAGQRRGDPRAVRTADGWGKGGSVQVAYSSHATIKEQKKVKNK